MSHSPHNTQFKAVTFPRRCMSASHSHHGHEKHCSDSDFLTSSLSVWDGFTKAFTTHTSTQPHERRHVTCAVLLQLKLTKAPAVVRLWTHNLSFDSDIPLLETCYTYLFFVKGLFCT